jgi:hypothetical protein
MHNASERRNIMHGGKRSYRPAKRSYWEKHVKRYYDTDLSQKEYCRQNNLSYWSFNMWKRRIDQKSSSCGLTEISRVKVRELSRTGRSFEILLGNTIRIAVPDDFDPEVLKNILKTLGATS